MTKQEVFNKVVTHLREQGEMSGYEAPPGVVCLYRNNGKKCAIGALISDEEYSEAFERQSVYGLSIRSDCPATVKQLVAEHGEWFLSRLQRIHDEYGPSKWDEQFEIFASEYGLELPEGKVNVKAATN
jgi:hypothetical protein